MKISGYIGNHVLATPVIMEMDEHGNYQNFFTSPFPATKLDIYVGQGLDHGNLMQVYIFSRSYLNVFVIANYYFQILKADINKGKKCVTLPYEDVQGDVKFLVLPLLHHY